jgi:ribosome biogenesis GTPase
MSQGLSALVIAAHGRQYRVRLDNGEERLCYPRGKKSEVVCGDHVRIRETQDGLGVIEHIETRKSLLYRSNAFRQKRIAANVDQVVLVVATEPTFSTDLLGRCLIAASAQGIASLIALNKCDLEEKLPRARQCLAQLTRLGYPTLEVSAFRDVAALRARLEGRTSVLVGQSGMGKSALINALVPGAAASTREISTALDSGKHTTTFTRLYDLDAQSRVIDSPGMQEFGLGHMTQADLEHAFPEFAPWLGACRFRDCRHRQEPGCALRVAVGRGHISRERMALFRTLMAENT